MSSLSLVSMGERRDCKCLVHNEGWEPGDLYRSLMIEDVVEGAPLGERSCVPAMESTTPQTTIRPRTRPNRNAKLLSFARLEKTIRMTVIIGMGLIATPQPVAESRRLDSP